MKDITDTKKRYEKVLELDKDINSFMKLNQIKMQVKSESLKHYPLKSEFSDY